MSSKDPSVYATCEVVVITPVTGVEIDKTRLEIKVGYNEKLTAGVLPETASYKELRGYQVMKVLSGCHNPEK